MDTTSGQELLLSLSSGTMNEAASPIQPHICMHLFLWRALTPGPQITIPRQHRLQLYCFSTSGKQELPPHVVVPDTAYQDWPWEKHEPFVFHDP